MGFPKMIESWVTAHLCGSDEVATLIRPLVNPHNWPVYGTAFLSYYWPAAEVGGHSCGCRADGPASLPHSRLLAVLSLEVS